MTPEWGTPERLEQIKREFERAIEIPPDEREAAFEALRREDPGIYETVLRLAADYDGAGEFVRPFDPGGVIGESGGTGASPAAADPQFHPGDVISGRFRIIRFIGAGGMGEVYEAYDPNLERSVALKAVRWSPLGGDKPHRRLRREALLALQVTHPNVCRILDLNWHQPERGERIAVLSMVLLNGRTLAGELKDHGPYGAEEAEPLVRQMIAALDAAHRVGVIHRDFKPSNVMLLEGSRQVVVTDFGLAIPADAGDAGALTTAGQIIGTPLYMAPEQLRSGEAGVRSDIYSLGVVLFELVTGKRPGGDTAGLEGILKRLLEPPPSPRELNRAVPAIWDEAIRRCLDPDPLKRFASVREVQAALEGRRAPLRLPRRRWLALAGGIAGAVALSAAGYRYWRQALPRARKGAIVVLADMADARDPAAAAVALLFQRGLEQSGHVRLWDQQRRGEVLRLMGRKPDEALSPADWRELALREGAQFVVFLSVQSLGEGFNGGVRLEEVAGSPYQAGQVWQQSFTAVNRSAVFTEADRGSRWLREILGENRPEVDATRPVDQVTTTSWEALTDFTEAERLAASGKQDDAIRRLELATARDPDFTMAWMRKGDILMAANRQTESFEAWGTAIALLPKRAVTRREELRLRAMFALDTGDVATSDKVFQQYRQLFPDDYYGPFYHNAPLLYLGFTDESIEALKAGERFPEKKRQRYAHLAWACLVKGDMAQAEEYSRKLGEMGEAAAQAEVEASIHFVAGRSDAAIASLRKSKSLSTPELAAQLALHEGEVLIDAGRFAEAETFLREELESDRKAGLRSAQALKLVNLAILALYREDRSAAASLAWEAYQLERAGFCAARAGQVCARAGKLGMAETIRAELGKMARYPITKVPYLLCEADVWLARGDRERARAAIEEAAKLDPPAYGRAYRAGYLLRTGQAAEQELRDAQRSRPLLLRIMWREPAGNYYWIRQAAVRHGRNVELGRYIL